MCSLGPYADKHLPAQPATSSSTSQSHLLSVCPSLISRGRSEEWEESKMERGMGKMSPQTKGLQHFP